MSNKEMDLLTSKYMLTERTGEIEMNSLIAYKIYCCFYWLTEGNYKNFKKFMEVYYNVK